MDFRTVALLVCFGIMSMLTLSFLHMVDASVDTIGELEQVIEQRDNKVSNLEKELQQYIPAGGTESPPPSLPDHSVVFPIHPDDFLRYTSPYGLRESPFFNVQMHHDGIDIATVWKAQVRSIADGVVVEHWPAPDGHFRGHRVYGGMVRIEHDGFDTLYAHLAETDVRTGQEVEAGEHIGRVGNTGMARGQHLHLEMRVQGELVNPLLYLDAVPDFSE